MSENPWNQHAPKNAFELADAEYAQLRPDYPLESVLAALHGTNITAERNTPSLNVADIGAGTGKFTALLPPLVQNVIAVEPAAAMREQCHAHLTATHPARTNWQVISGTGEKTGLPDASQDVLTYAQCWHWLDPQKAATEAARILKPGGHIAVIYNQMDVTIPWVQRLARIMRSGDVHTHDKPPALSANLHTADGTYPAGQTAHEFSDFQLHETKFETCLNTEQVLGLGRTRSSYLRSNPRNQAKMQDNLRWYLYEHLGYELGAEVVIPYYTLTWVAYRKS